MPWATHYTVAFLFFRINASDRSIEVLEEHLVAWAL